MQDGEYLIKNPQQGKGEQLVKNDLNELLGYKDIKHLLNSPDRSLMAAVDFDEELDEVFEKVWLSEYEDSLDEALDGEFLEMMASTDPDDHIAFFAAEDEDGSDMGST